MDVGTLELVELDVDLNLELGCGMDHNPTGHVPTCSGPVVALWSFTCRESFLVCAAGAAFAESSIADKVAWCGRCHNTKTCACWRVVPV